MYDVRLTLWSADTEAPVAQSSDRCTVCGPGDVAEMAAAQALNLREWIDNTAAAPAVLSIEARPRTAEVWIDGVRAGNGTARRVVAPGRHTIRVEAAGHEPTTRTVNLSRGVGQDLSVELRPTTEHPYRRPLGIAAVTTGVAATAGGAVLLGLDGREHRRRCNGDPGTVDVDGDCQYVYDTLVGGVVSTVAGVGLTAAGVTLLAIDRKDDGKRLAEFRLGVGNKRLTLRGRF